MNGIIIVTGCRRSGTTLLKSMLSQHPALLVHPDEPQFILQGWKRFGDSINSVEPAIDFYVSHDYVASDLNVAEFRKQVGAP